MVDIEFHLLFLTGSVVPKGFLGLTSKRVFFNAKRIMKFIRKSVSVCAKCDLSTLTSTAFPCPWAFRRMRFSSRCSALLGCARQFPDHSQAHPMKCALAFALILEEHSYIGL